MKKIALMLFLIFTAGKLVPGFLTMLSEGPVVCMAEKEKGEEKEYGSDQKEKKDYTTLHGHEAIHTRRLSTAIHLAEQIHPSPTLEKLTPPPNFC